MPHKRSFGEWLEEWVVKAIKPPARTLRAYETYRSVIATHLIPKLGGIPLQQLKAADLKRYYTEAGQGDDALAPAMLAQHHTIAHSALQAPVLEGLVYRNVAKLVTGKPHAPAGRQDALEHCWEAHEAKAFLTAAKAAGSQPAAFYALALDSGAREGELCGLKWTDVDFVNGRLTIQRQLVKPGPEPVIGPVKNKTPRTIELSAETIALLLKHRGTRPSSRSGTASATATSGSSSPGSGRTSNGAGTRSGIRCRPTTWASESSGNCSRRQVFARSSFTGCVTRARRCC